MQSLARKNWEKRAKNLGIIQAIEDLTDQAEVKE